MGHWTGKEYKKLHDLLNKRRTQMALENNVEIILEKIGGIEKLEMIAEQGNAEAQTALGLLYDRGKNIPKDDTLAYKWFLKASEQNDHTAQYELGSIYQYGNSIVKQDYEKALDLYLKSANQNNANAQCAIGFMYLHGNFVNKDIDEAIKWFMKSAEQNNDIAQLSLSLVYDNDDYIQKNHEESIKWLKKSVENGNKEATERLNNLSKQNNSGCLVPILIGISSILSLFILLIRNWR